LDTLYYLSRAFVSRKSSSAHQEFIKIEEEFKDYCDSMGLPNPASENEFVDTYRRHTAAFINSLDILAVHLGSRQGHRMVEKIVTPGILSPLCETKR
jgi:hypothetical protein